MQTTHIKDDSLVAIIFKTDTLPKYGHPEEVFWDQDVNLIDPKVVSQESAIQRLRNAPIQIPRDREFQVNYVRS